MLCRRINEGTERLTLWLKGNENEWDLLSPAFRKVIHNYLLQDDLKVDLVIGLDPQDPDLQHDLYRLSTGGASFFQKCSR